MDYTIDVTLEGDRVRAEPNPLPVEPNDNVTWLLGPHTDLEVEFTVVRDLSKGTLTITGPNGPFVSLSRQSGDRIFGTIKDFLRDPDRPHRFFYKISRNGMPLDWVNPAPAAPDKDNGGGIDTPGRPPG